MHNNGFESVQKKASSRRARPKTCAAERHRSRWTFFSVMAFILIAIAFTGTPDGAAQSSGGSGIGYPCQTPGPDTYGYMCDGIGSQFQSIAASGSVLSLGNDQVSSPLSLTSYGNLTFPAFNFYGKSYDQVFVSSNGFVSFVDPMTSGCCAGGTIPSTTDPNAFVAGYWVDLDPSAGGSIHYQGIASPDRYVIEFNGVPYEGSTNQTVTFQIVLYYGSDIIEVHFDEAGSDSRTTTTGIENAAADTGLTAQHGPGGLPQVESMFESTDGLYADFFGTTSLVDVMDLRIVDVFAEGAGRQVESVSADHGSTTLQVTTTTPLRFCQVDDGSGASASSMPLILAVGQTDCSGAVEAGDVLLTAAGGQSGGGFVSTGNPSIGKPFTTTLSGAFLYADIDSSGTYTLGDGVYAKASNTTLSTLGTGDLRLTPTASFGAFTRVQTGDLDQTDFGTSMLSLGGSLTGTAMRFFDAPPPAGLFIPPAESLPSAPKDPSTSAQGNEVTLQWSEPEDNGMSEVSAYHVYRGTDSTALSLVAVATADATAYTDVGLDDLTTYFYAVSASTAFGEGPATGATWVRTEKAGETRVMWDDLDDGVDDGWSMTGLWHLDTVCATAPTAPYYLGYHRVGSCDFETGGSNAGSATTSVDLTDWREATLAFDHRWETECCSGAWDAMRVEAKASTSGSWSVLKGWTAADPNQLGWRSVQLDLDPFAGGIVEIRFSFVTGDGAENLYEGWYIDDVEVTAAHGTASGVLGLVADGGPGAGEISIQWAAPADDGGCSITSYRLEVLENDVWLVLQNATATAYVHTGLGAGETHFYRVTPFNCMGAGTEATAEGTTFDVPSAPLLFSSSAGPGAGEIALDWVEPVGDGGTPVTHYNVYRNATGGSYDLIASPTGTSYIDTGLITHTTYHYFATAVNLAGEGAASSGSASTAIDVPSEPQDLSAATGPGAGEIALSWSAPADDGGSNVTGYKLYRSTTTGGSYTHIASPMSTSYQDSGLTKETTYFYFVSAVNAVGEGPTSTETSNTTFDVPSAPQGLAVEARQVAGRIGLEWSAPADDGGLPVSYYRVYRSTGPAGPFALLAEPSTTFHDDDGLPRHSTWYYFVAAVNDAGEGPPTPVLDNTTLYPPTEVQNLTGTAGPGAGGLELDWDPPVDDGGKEITHYNIHRALAEAGPYEVFAQTDLTWLGVAGLEDDTTYWFEVEPVNQVCCADDLARVNVTTFDLPSAPQDLAASADPATGNVTVTWAAPTDDGGSSVTTYNVYRGRLPSRVELIAELPATQTSMVEAGLPVGTWFYAVTANNTVGEGAAADERLQLRLSGALWSWGQNTAGQLGDGTTLLRTTPVAVLAPEGDRFFQRVVDFAAGGNHALAVRDDGTVWAWGSNAHGKLGDGTFVDRGSPVQVLGPGGAGILGDAVQVSGTNKYSLALLANGTVWAWGDGEFGKLGQGDAASSTHPVQVRGPGGVGYLDGIVEVSAGGAHVLALKEDGTVWSWGHNGNGRLGDGTTNTAHVPRQVVGPGGVGTLDGIVQVAAGWSHSMALMEDGTVWSWGDNSNGQLGDGSTSLSLTPTQVLGPGGVGSITDVVEIATQSLQSSALKIDGTAWGWGRNAAGQLGDGTTTQRTTPVQVVGVGGSGVLQDIERKRTGGGHGLAVAHDGTLFAWGNNGNGQFGDGSTTGSLVPVVVPLAAEPVDIEGGGQFTSALFAHAPPGQPREPAAAFGPGFGEITFTWTPPIDDGGSDLTQYRIRIGSASGLQDLGVVSVDPTVRSYTDAGLAGGERRFYTVVGVNVMGEGLVSMEVDATAYTLPSAPQGLTAAAGPGAGEITLLWSAPADDGGLAIGNYSIYRDGVFVANTTSTSYLDGGLADGATYTYNVTAWNAVGESGPSGGASATTFAVPAAPQHLSAVTGPGAGEIALSWSAPPDDGGSNVTGYTLYRSQATGGPYMHIASPTSLSYQDSGLTKDTAYFYVVSAVNVVGEGPTSTEATNTTFDVPSAPRDLSATAGPDPGAVSLAWSAPADDGGMPITMYVLYRDGVFLDNVSAATTSYVDTGLADATSYTYTVTAWNDVGESDASAPASATTYGVPSVPQGLAATAGPDPGEVSLSWSAPADDGGTPITMYVLYRDGAFLDNVSAATTSYVDTGLADATFYTYTVTAWNDVGESDASAPASAMTYGVPSAPQDVAASAGPGAGEIGVSWSAPADDGGTTVTEYHLYRDGTFLDNTTATSYLDTGRADGTTYAYDVSAVNAVGEGTRSATATATTFDVPTAPENLSVTAGPEPNEVSLAWDAPASDGGTPIDRYTVYRSGSSGGPWSPVGNPFNTTFLDTGRANGTTYHYQVSASNLVGEGAVSGEANATTFDVPPEPIHVAAAAGPAANEITVSWEPPEDDGGTPITQYVLFRDGAVISDMAVSPWSDDGLANGTTHAYTVRAMNVVGLGPHSATVSATTFDVASEPQNTTAQAGPGGGEITLAWEPSADDGGTPVTNYTIERRANDTDPWSTIGMTMETVFTDGGLGPNATWCYRVTALNLVGQGPYGATSCATTYDIPDAPPVSAASGSGFINVTWGASPDDGGAPVSQTRLYGGDDRTNLTLLATAGPQGGTYNDTGLPDGHWRHYAATAVTVAGESPFDSRVSARTFAAPEAPANTSARSGPEPGEVTVGFQTPADDGGRQIMSFQVYRGLAPDDLSLVATLAPANVSSEPSGSMVAYSYVDSGLGNGTTFYYSVSATNDEGEGPLSAPVFGTTYVSNDPPEPLPSGRTLTSATFDGRYVYVFGGLAGNTSDGTSIDHIVRFDPVNQTNEVFDALPAPRHGTSSVWVPGNESAYIFFGDDQNGTEASASTCHPGCHVGTQILKYTPLPLDADASASSGGTIAFIEVDEDVHARHATASVYVPPEFDQSGRVNGTGVAYVFGGKAPESEAQASTCHPGCHVGSQIGVLDPVLDKFDIHSSQLPQSMWGTSSVYVPPVAGVNGTGLIWLFGGHEADDGASGSTCHPGCHIGTQILGFDPRTAQFHFSTSTLPSERWFTSATFDGQYAYIFGGQDANGTIDEIVRFDPTTGEVGVVGGLPSERGGTSAVSTPTGMYIFGGEGGNETLDEVVQFRPEAPQAAEAKPGGGRGQNTVSWRPPANAFVVDVAGYRVYAGEDPEALSLLAVLPDTQEAFVHGGLGDGETWYYRVSAFTVQDEGPQSDTLVAKTFTRPSAPRDLAAEKEVVSGIVHLSWDPPADDGGTPIEQYHVYRRDGPTGDYTVIGNVSPAQTTYADSGCTVGKVCDYHVVAFNLVGGGDLSDQVTVIGTRVG